MKETKLREWETIDTEEVFSSLPWVRVYQDKIRLPGGRAVEDYYRVALPDYSIIYAENMRGEILLIRQYKHATGKIIVGLPAGAIEENETPLDAAKRELKEETGYTSCNWFHIGSFMVDGSKGCGRANLFKASGLRKVAEPVTDDMEEVELCFMEPGSVLQSVVNGDIPLLASAGLIAMAMNPVFCHKGRGRS